LQQNFAKKTKFLESDSIIQESCQQYFHKYRPLCIEMIPSIFTFVYDKYKSKQYEGRN